MGVDELEDVVMQPGEYPATSDVAGEVTYLDLGSELLPECGDCVQLPDSS